MVRAMDNTDSAILVIFDRDATLLFGESCANLLQTAVPGVLPSQISGLVDRTLLFKVEAKPNANQRFEQSFRVRKICADAEIVKQFKDKWEREEAIFLKNTNV